MVFKVNSKQWGFRRKYKDANGKWHEVKRTKFKSKKEASLAEADFLKSLNSSTIDYSTMTFTELINKYRESYRVNIKEQTMIAYKRIENTFFT